MIASLAVLSVLAQDVALPPPPPPPLVPADVPAPPRPPPATAYAPPPVIPADAPQQGEPPPPTGTRIVGSIGAGFLGAAATTGALVWVGGMRCGSSAACGIGSVYAGIGTVLLGAAAISLGSWAAHRLLGGKSSVGWALLGTVAGAALGLFGTFFIDNAIAGSRGPSIPLWGFAVTSTALAAIGGATMSELGHFLVVREAQSVATGQRF